MLHELLDLRAALIATLVKDDTTIYERKLEIIQNNLYGVDIDPFAVNIARLRLWLWLAVDREGDPLPLPNLDFKIEAGDSLLVPGAAGFGQASAQDDLVRQFRDVKRVYLRSHHEEKKRLHVEAGRLREDIASWAHAGNQPPSGFDWQVEFAEVFIEEGETGGGFDIVLANPPYVRMELFKEIKTVLRANFAYAHGERADLYIYFYARALEILRPGGMLAFISSNKWFRADYGAKLRAHIAATCHVVSITDFGELPVFNAATFPMIFVAQAGAPAGPTTLTLVKSLAEPYPDVLAIARQEGQALPGDALASERWTLADAGTAAVLRRMETGTVPLGQYVNGQIYYGIKTGFNPAFVIDGAKRAALVAQDARSDEIIKPLAVGDDVRKWRIDKRDAWLIVTPIGTDIHRYPAIFAHLKQWQPQLEKRWDQGHHWWELRACDYYAAFDQPKIVYPEIAKEPRFAFDSSQLYTNNKAFFIPLNDLYLLAVLNSSLAWDYMKLACAVLGDENRGGRVMLQWVNLKRLPIPQAPEAERAAIATLARRCVDARGVGCTAWEREIDERVARLYGVEVK